MLILAHSFRAFDTVFLDFFKSDKAFHKLLVSDLFQNRRPFQCDFYKKQSGSSSIKIDKRITFL